MAKSTSTSTGRVDKRARSPRVTRSKSAGWRTSASASSGGMLERMVEEAGGSGKGGEELVEEVWEGMECASDGGVESGGVEDGEMDSEQVYRGKGKGKVAALSDDDGTEEGEDVEDEKPFRLFDLPTEIRLEIYRACLTRPYNILLSKVEKPAPHAAKEQKEEDGDPARDETTVLRPNWVQLTVGSLARQPMQFGSARRRGAGRGGARGSTLRASSSSSAQSSSAPAPSGPTTVVVGDPRQSTTKLNPNPPPPPPVTDSDPLLVALLRASKTVYKEARDVLYAENDFTLNIFTAVPTLACLHQRSRRRIKRIELEIPTYTEILESFSETVRLSLRYCFGLRRLVIHTPFTLPGGEGGGPSVGNSTVYANGFDILRWLPQGCEVVVEGTRNREIDLVVGRHMQLAGLQDQLAYARRQLISNEGETLVPQT